MEENVGVHTSICVSQLQLAFDRVYVVAIVRSADGNDYSGAVQSAIFYTYSPSSERYFRG